MSVSDEGRKAAIGDEGGAPLHLSLVTLGVGDLARAVAFYEAMGLERRMRAAEGVAFYHAGTIALALYPRDALAADAGVLEGEVAPASFSAIAFACNRPSRQAVDATIARMVSAGGKVLRPAEATVWGGYCGYVADPDGHMWEIAHNSGFPLDEQGRVRVPE